MGIKKNIFAPLVSGLGATRRAAMLLLMMMLTMAQTAGATDKTLSGSESYTAQDGDVLTGSTSGTVTIAGNANITLNNATITGGIVCEGSATITLAGTNSVTGAYLKAGIQIGGSGTTLTIKGDGSLTANGGNQSAGIGLSRAWDVDATGGDIVIEGGNITATGNDYGAGIGTGVSWGDSSAKTATIGNITIKGGTVRAIGGTNQFNPGSGIGKGGAYSYGHAVVGTITIYDGIDMVDATSISESVTYMHDNTDVTANASNYFTITEDGDHRIIVPKDDTDYTITIANDIEHGTLTGAATAKYMEKVTITATPALGYRFSRLVVKDAQNNDVESTGNSFFMPKSNVTVSAVFEQGVHGTTEFAWGYSGQESFVTEATIYDGVTTVELQQGKSYRIYKYDESSYRKFLLDNDTYYATIPYSGGTGTFTYANGTNFNINSGELGFYDITMTDVGNGKWSVSILKTVGVIDNIPDQTYTGSEIKPEPLVMAGSLSLNKGTDYEYSYENNTNVGTAKVTVTFKGDYASLGSVEKEFKIVKSMTNNDITVTIQSQTWTGNELTPVITVKDGETVLTENTDYTVTAPNGTIQNAGDYTYTITGMGNYFDSREATFTIIPKERQDGAVTIVEDQTGTVATIDESTQNGGVVPDDITNATLNYTRTIPAGTDAWTVCLPYVPQTTGVTYYTLSGVSGTTLNFTEVASPQANTPYLVVASSDASVGTSAATVVNFSAEVQNPEAVSGYTLKGTLRGLAHNASIGKYILQAGNKWGIVDDSHATVFIPPFRAYIEATNGARSLDSDFDDDTTGIDSIRTIDSDGKEQWFDLSGRRLSGMPTKKGLYIQNGKKVVMK